MRSMLRLTISTLITISLFAAMLGTLVSANAYGLLQISNVFGQSAVMLIALGIIILVSPLCWLVLLGLGWSWSLGLAVRKRTVKQACWLGIAASIAVAPLKITIPILIATWAYAWFLCHRDINWQ
ncbi:hypothetical protein [Chitinimonas taiwanensis]|uniref:hypothetical protein n=1 Tax=Chitinimonas taiwanensis TaxID=240412 RepID=UPI0011147679|nr:hypothetical protein [Chitinimonas taiwanensis]